jgi:hypothetical protein
LVTLGDALTPLRAGAAWDWMVAKDSAGVERWSIWCWEAPHWLGCLFEHLVLQIEYYYFLFIFFIS